VLLPLLALLAGAGIAVALLQSLAGDPQGSTAEAAEQRDSGSIVIDANDYIGQPIDVATQRLTALGLDVEPRPEPRGDVVPDQVVDVDPAGTPLSPGARVVVTYAVPESDDGQQRDGAVVTGASGGGRTAAAATEPAESPESVVVEQAAAPVTTEAAPPTTLPGGPTETEQPPATATETTSATDTESPPATDPTEPTEPPDAPSTEE
jgi:serine/threonine-protein kinase